MAQGVPSVSLQARCQALGLVDRGPVRREWPGIFRNSQNLLGSLQDSGGPKESQAENAKIIPEHKELEMQNSQDEELPGKTDADKVSRAAEGKVHRGSANCYLLGRPREVFSNKCKLPWGRGCCTGARMPRTGYVGAE